jgi:DNA-binding winged helix-turn-helix (wHTH) protein/tetratricopeptide (TPR) repeat protein
MDESRTISFDGWTLDRASGELRRTGQVTRLSQQPLRVLIELADNAGQVVTRERLVQLLWPKGIVDFDNSLNGIVRKLRVTLGDDSETPRYIETLPRVGYRFLAKPDSPSLRSAVRSRWPIWVAVAAGSLSLVYAGWWLARPEPVTATAPDTAATLVPRRTTSVRAYEHYLDGIYQRSRRDVNGAPLALKSFEAALREDPEYAEAWAALSATLLGMAIVQENPLLPTLTRARDAAQRAVLIDESLADAHAALGQVHTFFDRDYAAAERAFARALQLDEKLARGWHGVGVLRAFQGRPDEALAAMRRARELEPMTPHFSSQYGLLLYHSRRFEEAIAHLRPLVDAQPKFDQARSVLVRAMVALGQFDAASSEAALRLSDVPNYSDAGLIHAAAGRRTEAAQEITRIEKLRERGGAVSYELAVLHSALGAVQAACDALAQAVEENAMFLGWTRLDPRLDPLRHQPCFDGTLKLIYPAVPMRDE